MAIEDIKTFVFGIIIVVLSIVGLGLGNLVENPQGIGIMGRFAAAIMLNGGLLLLLGGVWKSKTLITVAFALVLVASGLLIPNLIYSFFYAPYDAVSIGTAIVLLCFIGAGLVFVILSFTEVQK